jgi:Xaa-Pro aminopeptidase
MPDVADYPRFAAEEMKSRHQKVYALMEEANVDAMLTYGAGRFSDIYWLTDWPGSREAYVLFQRGAEPVVLAQLYNHIPVARLLSTVEDVRWAGANTAQSVIDLLHERAIEGRRIGIVGSLPHTQYNRIHSACPEAELVELGGKFRQMRAIRSEPEIKRIRYAAELTDRSMAALRDALRPGIREEELPAVLENEYLKAGGYSGIHFMTSMPMRAPNFPVPAQYQSTRTLQRGDCLITEISGAYWGYSGQIHRTYSIGEGPTPEWQDLHAAAVEAFEAILGVIKDGTSTREVEEVAECIHRRGYTIYDDLLHGANQYPPIIQTKSTSRREGGEMFFRENMVVTIQPNVITSDERMGLQFGETVAVRKNGCEPLHNFPREWIVCPT